MWQVCKCNFGGVYRANDKGYVFSDYMLGKYCTQQRISYYCAYRIRGTI